MVYNQVERLIKSEEIKAELSTEWKIGDPRVVTFLMKECLQALLSERSEPRSYGELFEDQVVQERRRAKAKEAQSSGAAGSILSGKATVETPRECQTPRGVPLTARGAGPGHPYSSPSGPTPVDPADLEEDTPPPSVFDPIFFRAFGQLLFGVEGAYEKALDANVPLDASAYLATIGRIDKADPLGCEAYHDLRDALVSVDKVKLLQATKKRQLAYDHVEVVARDSGTSGVLALYVARAKPDKWQPWTKSDHRRKMLPGTWVCRQPANSSREAFWVARRQIALLEDDDAGDDPAGEFGDELTTAYLLPTKNRYTMFEMQTPRNGGGRGQLARLKRAATRSAILHKSRPEPESDDRVALAYFYRDLLEASHGLEDGTQRLPLSELQLLNTHLGKAGGLNFGLEAVLMTEGVVPPTETRPLIYAIIDARHACDCRYWLQVLPAFHELHGNRGNNEVKFDPEICLCQVPHSYIGMDDQMDKLDMRNDFLFSGMAIVRDRCYGMTSAGTGGTWAVTSSEGAGDFFFGRTMIEDSSSSHAQFIKGRRSVYLPPSRGTMNQLMRAVPKVSSNYLEALERWDTGAVQLLVAQGLGATWLWQSIAVMLCIEAAIIIPAFVPPVDASLILARPLEEGILATSLALFVSFGVLFSIFLAVAMLSIASPRALNYCLRFLIILFNSTYPFVSIASVFWLAIPPYLCIAGAFPFSLNAYAAIIGSGILKFVEWSIIGKMKKDADRMGAELAESSIFRSQQMDKVTVPIKMRAVLKGLLTGYADVVRFHDNSWWESYGGGKAAQWVKVWLVLLTVANGAAIIAGPIVLGLAYQATGNVGVTEVALPVGFGLIQAILNIWMIWDPLLFILKGGVPRLTMRKAELVVLLLLAIVTFVLIEEAANTSPEA